ncbi:hypothetical protein DFS34DRAFT_59069 [Phlyctochytrium arcticum]|nr:hypothetical protein DFS34DRAFT_59069 [Phlyctochytrium arcticum]
MSVTDPRTSQSAFPTTETSGTSSLSEVEQTPGTYAVWPIAGEPTEVILYEANETALSRRPNGKPKPRTVLVMVPGNPGVPDYYESFLGIIHKACQEKIDIIAVQHLGHSTGVSHTKNYSTDDQIRHKVALVDLIPEKYGKDAQIILMGHSFGAWVIVQVLRVRPKANIVKVFALFPVLHSIVKSPRARFIKYAILPGLRNVAPLLISFLRTTTTALHPRLFTSLVSVLSGQKGRDLAITCNKLLTYRTVLNTLYLTSYEFRVIDELDDDVIARNVDKMVFYYGTTDGWVPVEHYEDMKQRFPKAEIYLCRDDLPHAFVMGYADIMGAKVAQWIQKVLDAQS